MTNNRETLLCQDLLDPRNLLGSPGGHLEAPWDHLEAPGGPLEAPWTPLEAPWRPLGDLLDALGAPLAPLAPPELIWELLRTAFERSWTPPKGQKASQRLQKAPQEVPGATKIAIERAANVRYLSAHVFSQPDAICVSIFNVVWKERTLYKPRFYDGFLMISMKCLR